MPLLQYQCPQCKKHFDELVKNFTDSVFCPDCKTLCVRSYSGVVMTSTGKPVKKCSGNCKTCSGCR